MKSVKPSSRGRSASQHRPSKKSERWTADNNPCKYCKRHRRHKRHKWEPAKCHFNKCWKGFRPEHACRVLDVPFRPREEFTPEMGGYAEAYVAYDAASSSSSEEE